MLFTEKIMKLFTIILHLISLLPEFAAKNRLESLTMTTTTEAPENHKNNLEMKMNCIELLFIYGISEIYMLLGKPQNIFFPIHC